MAKSLPLLDIVTLGCSKNLVESERIGTHAAQHGYRVVYDQEPEPGAKLLINTCGFIGDAKAESIDHILRAESLRRRGQLEELMVMGCLSQRYRSELPAEIPGVDRWYGVHENEVLLRDLGCPTQDYAPWLRMPSTPSHYAYMKIAEGCDRACAFCAIPMIRGRFHSQPVEELVREARHLATGGVKELILIAQELTHYGYDLGQRDLLIRLLWALDEVPGLEWVRLHYAYPMHFPEELIDWLRESPRACRYLDVPLQHISQRVLRSMRRAHTESQTRDLVARLRTAVPDLALRTTLMVGFPTETDQDFEALRDFVREARFDHLGVFTYSEEEGTPAAQEYEDVIPQEVKDARRDELMALQQEIAAARGARLVGTEMDVILDHRVDGETLLGRTPYDSPEVDGEVIVIDREGRAQVGEIRRVRITASSIYDLQGEVIA